MYTKEHGLAVVEIESMKYSFECHLGACNLFSKIEI